MCAVRDCTRSRISAPLVRCGQPQPGLQALPHGGVAAGPAEDEQDRRQQAVAVQALDDVGAQRCRPAPPATAPAAASAPVEVDPAGRLPGVAQQFRVHVVGGRGLGVVEQVEHPLADQHVLPQRHRPVLADHHGRLAAHGDQPVGELLGVGHGRRQRHQRDALRQVDDDLFPDRAAEPVGQVVHLVHHHVAETVQGGRTGVEHVAQHLGGHHHHGRVAVDRVVAGQQADLGRAVALGQVVELLVGQRLDRRGVEALAPAPVAPARSARCTANSPTTVLPAPVGAQTSTPPPSSSASQASRWNGSRSNGRSAAKSASAG